jgi:hypothetical protein
VESDEALAAGAAMTAGGGVVLGAGGVSAAAREQPAIATPNPKPPKPESVAKVERTVQRIPF